MDPTPKIVIVTKSAETDPPDKVINGRALIAACGGASAVVASAACQAALPVLKTATDALDTNQIGKKANLAARIELDQGEPTLVIAYDSALDGMLGALKPLIVLDPTLIQKLDLTQRATPVVGGVAEVPTGVNIRLLGSGVPKLHWLGGPGVKMYIAQMSPNPPTDASWSVIYGTGLSRLLDMLVPGQAYAFRVCAVATNGLQTAWSAPITFVGVVPKRQKKAK